MDPSSNCIDATITKRKKKKGGAKIGRHRRGKKQKQCRQGAITATFPIQQEPSATSLITDFPIPFLALRKPSDLPIMKHLRNKADYAYRKCAKTDETVKKLLAEKELVNNHHLDHVYTQKKLCEQVIVSQANEQKALNLLESRTKRLSNCLANEKEKTKANKKQCTTAALLSAVVCKDAKKSVQSAKKEAELSIKDAKRVAKKSTEDALKKAKHAAEDAKRRVEDAKQAAAIDKQEQEYEHKEQLALIARDHGEDIKKAQIKAKANVKVAVEQGDLRLERSRRTSKVLRGKLKSDLEKEKKEMHKEHKSKNATLLKEKRKITKNSICLHSRLDTINMSLELLRSEHSYQLNIAVNQAKREERYHFATVIRTQKDESRKMMEEGRKVQAFSMTNSDRAITAERELTRLQEDLKSAKSCIASLSSAFASSQEECKQIRVLHAAVTKELADIILDEGAAITLLTNKLSAHRASVAIQNLAIQVVASCTCNGEAKLKRCKGKVITYAKVNRGRALKSNAKPKSRNEWIRKRVSSLVNDIGSHGEALAIELLKALCKKEGMIFAPRSDFQLSVAQSLVLRDHVGTGTNGLYRMKQAIEIFCPALKGIVLPPNIRRHISLMERDGVVPSRTVQVCCTVTKKGNKRAMVNFYYCARPSQLLENMIRRMFMDNTFQESYSFSSLVDQIVISVGFDKSDSDFVGTWRPCNRKGGNSALYVQTFACLEGPVSEDYANEMLTIGKPEYPIRYTIQSLVDDSLQALVFTEVLADGGNVKNCGCFIFTPSPPTPPGMIRSIEVDLSPDRLTESVAFVNEDSDLLDEGSPDDLPDDNTGLPPTIPMMLTEKLLKVTLVVLDDDASVVVGIRIIVNNSVVKTQRLHQHLKLRSHPQSKVVSKCYQLSGHLSNDGKQINILTGQGSCSVAHPMPCCMVNKNDLGRPPLWIRIRLRRTTWSLPSAFNDKTMHLISQWVGCPLYADPPTREGELSFGSTHALWRRLTVDGRNILNAEERRKANTKTGSSFNEPIFDFPCKKQNCGIMHDPAGHITHFMNNVSDCIREKMNGCEWQLRVMAIDGEVKRRIVDVNGAKKSSVTSAESRSIATRIRQIRKQKKDCEVRAEREQIVELRSQFHEEAKQLGATEEAEKDALREQTALTEIGDYNLILQGLKEFQDVLKAKNALDGKRPQSSLEFALWKAVESRAGGKLDTKNSGKEQTNGKGMNSMENFEKVTHALLGMYPVDHEVHQWLALHVGNWNALASAIYDVGCFLKSQKKRSPSVCDSKLFNLWNCWQCAFPGRKFNKFHGMFCTIRNFVHTYHMTGRISEESNEAFNGTLANVKSKLKSMPTTATRVEVTNARTQSNLKGEILDLKVALQEGTTGKKRGPQKPRTRSVEDMILTSMSSEYVEFKGEIFVKLVSGNLLPKAWEDLYQWFGSAIAPKEWIDGMANTTPSSFSNVERARERLTQF